MLQAIDPIELTVDEQAAVETAVAERRANGEPDLTAAQLLARMVRKLFLAEWTVRRAADAKAEHLARAAAAYDRCATEADRMALIDTIERAAPAPPVDAAAPELEQR